MNPIKEYLIQTHRSKEPKLNKDKPNPHHPNLRPGESLKMESIDSITTSTKLHCTDPASTFTDKTRAPSIPTTVVRTTSKQSPTHIVIDH